MNQATLLNVLYDAEIYGDKHLNAEVTTLVNDSRKVVEGTCFIAIRGEHFDGHSALREVVEHGARLLVVEEVPKDWQQMNATIVKVRSTFRAQAILANTFYNEPSKSLNLVAVTGTNGKTTTSSMISDLLSILGRQTGLIGTLHYKVAETYYPAVNTTPNALELHRLYAEMVKKQCQDAVIEASSHALQLGRLWYSDVDCAIFTNLTREHLDFHKTMDSYAYAKSLLFAQMGQTFHNHKPRLAIINTDDPYSEVMMSATAADIVTYSLEDEQATVYADNIASQSGQTQFDLHYKGGLYSVIIPMRGTYNVSNYMAAFLCLVKYYNFTPDDVVEATKEFKGVAGRMQSIKKGQPFEIIVDFAHTSDALQRVMAELAKRKNQRLIALMGHSGGNRDSGARPSLGDILFEYGDYIVFTADNPRFEDITKISREMIQQHDEKPYTIIEDRQTAIEYTLNLAEPGDIVLFAGKGGEPYQVIGDENIPYNEVEVIEELLNNHHLNE